MIAPEWGDKDQAFSWMPTAAAAARVGVARRTLSDWLEKGRIPLIRESIPEWAVRSRQMSSGRPAFFRNAVLWRTSYIDEVGKRYASRKGGGFEKKQQLTAGEWDRLMPRRRAELYSRARREEAKARDEIEQRIATIATSVRDGAEDACVRFQLDWETRNSQGSAAHASPGASRSEWEEAIRAWMVERRAEGWSWTCVEAGFRVWQEASQGQLSNEVYAGFRGKRKRPRRRKGAGKGEHLGDEAMGHFYGRPGAKGGA